MADIVFMAFVYVKLSQLKSSFYLVSFVLLRQRFEPRATWLIKTR